MRIDLDSRVALAAVAGGFIVLTACAVHTGTQAPSGPERAAVDASSAEVEVAAGQPETDTSDETASAEDVPGEGDIIAELLADRRRRDYPEIELQESGFTITEQVRIGGDARTEYERALSLLRQERYAEGIQMLLDITESTPGATVPYIDLGIAYEQTGELEQAEKALDTAALLSPDNPIVQNELGILYRKTGRFDEARASYEKALAVFNDFHFARRNLAVLCDLYLADLECALQNYRAYLDSVADDPQVEIWIADVENRMGN